MADSTFLATVSVSLHVLMQVALAVRVMLRPHRDPASRVAWLVVIFAIPVLGLVAYILLGETNIGRNRARRRREIVAQIPQELKEASTGA